MQLIGLVALSIYAGVNLAYFRVSWKWCIPVYGALYLVLNYFGALPWFSDDPRTWLVTYYTGLCYYFAPALMISVLPTLLAQLLAKSFFKKKEE